MHEEELAPLLIHDWLTERALAHGKAIGCEEAWVGTEPDNLPARALYEALECGDYPAWHRYTTDQIEDSGQHEVLNWFCLLGAMEALGRKPDKATFIETWAFVSPVVFAYYNA